MPVSYEAPLSLFSIAQWLTTHAKTTTTGNYNGPLQIPGLPVLAPYTTGQSNGYGACFGRSQFYAGFGR